MLPMHRRPRIRFYGLHTIAWHRIDAHGTMYMYHGTYAIPWYHGTMVGAEINMGPYRPMHVVKYI